MNQKKRENNILIYLQVLAFGLILVFSPCSVRNAVQDSLDVTQTGVTNKSKTTNSFEELCSTFSFDVAGDHPAELINTTPGAPAFRNTIDYTSRIQRKIEENSSFCDYESPTRVKDKTPLYLLHQQFKVYLQEA